MLYKVSAMTTKPTDVPQIDAHFESAADGTITFVFRVLGLSTVDEADRFAECMRGPINKGFCAFFGFDEMRVGSSSAGTIH
jgi:hypothetical protein